jgi:predicted DNA-binding protein YlxM (UPF0122 family)
MTQVEERETIRRAYYDEQKSMREIAEELHHGRETVAAVVKEDAPILPKGIVA